MRQELFEEALQLIVAAVEQREVVMVDAGEWGYRRELGMRCAAKNWERHPVRKKIFDELAGRGWYEWSTCCRAASEGSSRRV
ncbi:hypothetical protein TSOC_001545 [Tetrabaena socialis]|uniref:Uncharacterized protein n=1 Tax=Tetrabaena socialis TaxID=47790 RepID=A0A2J8AGG6_9CHLO|nr:hypothetical protein TSOC_001545 [Tetrabaena socialis]|eukprot:PNH11615.1 hypothetical protein TSOC_001545 [Tetrabaena socialis]